MKTKIYYFSGTGNSLAAARKLAEKFEDPEIVSIPSVLRKGDIRCDTGMCGIIFPVYSWGPPVIVTRFLNRLKTPEGSYVFSVCTCGGSAGSTLPAVKRILKRNGIELSSAFILKMLSNYIVWSGAAGEEEQKEKLAEADSRIEEIAEAVFSRKKLPPEKDYFFINAVSGLIYKLFSLAVAKQDKMFFADEKCNGCSICEKICPVENIDMTSGRPEWLHRCEQCMACIQFCPQEALQCSKKSAGRRRYHHPDIKASDIISGNKKIF